jgi:hypothetical protein
MKIIIYFVSIAIFIFTLISCDPGSDIKYEIWNKTDKPIIVKYYFVFSNNEDTCIRESQIEPNQIKTINEEMHLGSVKDFNESRDSIFIYSMTVMQDNLISKINFKDKHLWRFESKGDYIGIYQLKVGKEFFRQ